MEEEYLMRIDSESKVVDEAIYAVVENTQTSVKQNV